MSQPPTEMLRPKPLLPAHVLGLMRLHVMLTPDGFTPEVWAELVGDCHQICRGGWATTALALGWDARELWGVFGAGSSLAVWLVGDPIVMLDDRQCVAGLEGMRRVYRRTDNIPRMLIWQIGTRAACHDGGKNVA